MLSPPRRTRHLALLFPGRKVRSEILRCTLQRLDELLVSIEQLGPPSPSGRGWTASGVFASRRGPGEGLVPSPSVVVPGYLMLFPLRIPLPRSRKLRRNQTEAEKRHRLCCHIESWTRNLAPLPHRELSCRFLRLRTSTGDGGRWRRFISQASPMRKHAVMMRPRRATDPSPVLLRQMKAPVLATGRWCHLQWGTIRDAGHSREKLALSLPKGGNPASFWTDVDPRLRGGDNTGDFHLLGWAAGP